MFSPDGSTRLVKTELGLCVTSDIGLFCFQELTCVGDGVLQYSDPANGGTWLYGQFGSHSLTC
jgi:hypothetical protein